MLRDDIPWLLEQKAKLQTTLDHNEILFNIYEGDLLTYVLKDLEAQLSENLFKQMKHRTAPINVLIRMISKLSKIYRESPRRELSSDSEKDKEIYDFYVSEMNVDSGFQIANELFNLFKTTLIEPYLHDGGPRFRVIPSHKFFVCSKDAIDPMKPTHVVKIMGKMKRYNEDRVIMYAYTADEFLIFDQNGEILTDMMAEMGADGVNPYGVLPFVYMNRSKQLLTPLPDTDTLQMTKLIPILLSDLNYAVMYQSFSVVWGIDIDFTNLTQAPNALWSFKSDPTSDKTPQIGTIKPQVDIPQVLQFIQAQMALWMQTRNIKTGSASALTVDNASSGIAKAIDEMDTSEDRAIQTKFFSEAEYDFWNLVFNHMHPIWMRYPDFGLKAAFSPEIEVTTTFPVQKPILDASKLIDDGIKKLQNGLATREMVVQEIYPDKTPEQVEEIIEELNEPNVIEVSEQETESEVEDETETDQGEMNGG